MTACFAERTVVMAAGAVPLPAELPLWQAALLGCGVVTAFGAVRNVGRVAAGESVAVIGCGGVGLHVVAAARMAGADPLIAVDRDPAKLELARARGATHVVEAGSATTATRVLRLTNGGVEHAFEVVGIPETMRLAWDVLRSGGTAVVVGLAARGQRSRSRPSSSCPTRGSAARTTGPATRWSTSRASPSSRSRATSIWPGSSRRSTGWTGSRQRSSGCAAERARGRCSSWTRRWPGYRG